MLRLMCRGDGKRYPFLLPTPSPLLLLLTKPQNKQALGLMSLAGNIPPSLHELFLLADEIWFLAGDDAVDMSWYTKRMTLSSIYAATETYSTTDQSTDFKDTEEFLSRRLEEARFVGGAWRNVSEWMGFQRMATVNLARNWGVRI
jgi:ubiquinone biosynthesis protein COQ9